MSLLQRVVVCAVGFMLVSSAVGENDIRQWAGPAAQISNESYVTIVQPGTYGFEALDVDPNDPNNVLGLGVFQEIAVDPNCPAGTVNVYILRDPNQGGGPGALDVYYLHLDPNNPNVIGNIAELNITGDLGLIGPTRGTNAGALTVADALLSDLWIDNAITGDVIIDTLAADIRAYSMQDLTVTQGSGSFTPSITVAGSTYSATMQVGCALYELYFGGGMSGVVDLSAPLLLLTAWNVGIAGSFTTAAGIDVDEVNIHGSASGTVSIGGSVTSATVVTDVSGTLSVAGTLKEGLIGDDVSGTITADYIGVV